MCDRLLVLLRRERAGGIDQPPAGAQRGGGAVEDGALPGRAGGHGRLRPVAHGLRLAAEHPLARARRVHEDDVEILRQRGGEFCRIAAGDDGVCHAHALEIAFQDLCAARFIFVGKQNPLTAERGRELAGFSARRGAHVKHAHARNNSGERGRRRGAGLLHIVDARVVVCVEPRAYVLPDEVRRRAERRRRHRKRCGRPECLRLHAQRIDGHAPEDLRRRGVQLVEPIPQQSALPRFKFCSRHTEQPLSHSRSISYA